MTDDKPDASLSTASIEFTYYELRALRTALWIRGRGLVKRINHAIERKEEHLLGAMRNRRSLGVIVTAMKKVEADIARLEREAKEAHDGGTEAAPARYHDHRENEQADPA